MVFGTRLGNYWVLGPSRFQKPRASILCTLGLGRSPFLRDHSKRCLSGFRGRMSAEKSWYECHSQGYPPDHRPWGVPLGLGIYCRGIITTSTLGPKGLKSIHRAFFGLFPAPGLRLQAPQPGSEMKQEHDDVDFPIPLSDVLRSVA